MDTPHVVAIVSGALALASALLTALFNFWSKERVARLTAEVERLRVAEQRRIELERTTARYREPLARAAYDLQSRLYNILEQRLLMYCVRGTPREGAYVVNNTTFLFAQYFAWTEIVRRDVQISIWDKTSRLVSWHDCSMPS